MRHFISIATLIEQQCHNLSCFVLHFQLMVVALVHLELEGDRRSINDVHNDQWSYHALLSKQYNTASDIIVHTGHNLVS